MKNSIWQKRIPTLLGIFFIVIGIGLTSFLVKQGIIVVGKASPTLAPKQVVISNVTDSSFTVSYLTEIDTVGSINYGKDQKFGQIGRDDRDQETNKLTQRKVHNITIRGLSPLTKYYFSITNGEETFLNEELPYNVQTGSVVSDIPPQQVPLLGKVITVSGIAPKEALVFASIDGSQTISTLLKEDGSYILPLNSLRNIGLSSFFDFSKEIIKIEIISDDFSKSTVFALIKQNPIPIVTLSKNYDFQSQTEPIASESAEAALSGLSSEQLESEGEISISSPVENTNYTDNRPLFTGTAMPNKEVTITIHSDEGIEVTVTTDAQGNWTYRPATDLSPGEHTIIASAKDSNGTTKSITKAFAIFEEGSRVAEAATPSATPTFVPTPTITPIPTATLTPILTLSPTPISSPTPTFGPTGNSFVTDFGILGLAIALLGVFLFLLSHGSVTL